MFHFFVEIFEASKSDEFDPLISEAKDLMLLAHNCIYKCESTNQTDNVLAILNCLPERGFIKKSASAESLHDLIDDLDAHFKAVRSLQKYEVSLTVDKMKGISRNGSQTAVEELFIDICRSASKM
jgi:hypothetical protein